MCIYNFYKNKVHYFYEIQTICILTQSKIFYHNNSIFIKKLKFKGVTKNRLKTHPYSHLYLIKEQFYLIITHVNQKDIELW